MPLIINRQWAPTDPWTLSEPDALHGFGFLDPTSPVWVSWDAYDEHRALFDGRQGQLAIVINNDMDLSLLVADLPALSMIAIPFPHVADGRGFSLARLLRQTYGFDGQIRAIGDVSRDRLQFMERCGFNAMALPDTEKMDDILTAFSDITQPYQRSTDYVQN